MPLQWRAPTSDEDKLAGEVEPIVHYTFLLFSTVAPLNAKLLGRQNREHSNRLSQCIAWGRLCRKFDPRGEIASLAHDHIHATVKLADPHDTGEVANVVVLEDQVARWVVVADVARGRIITCRYAIHGQLPGELRDRLHAIEVAEGQCQRQVGD